MINREDKNILRKKKHQRVRAKISGTSKKPRLNVFRSLSNISVQIIDDEAGKTLVSASSVEPAIEKLAKGKTKTQIAKVVGAEAAKRAKAKKITEVVFDRGGYLYQGRVKAVAEGAREGGLKF
ncbi:MAG: 50S ribosomal protein L18 [Firmicutes bacterium]|nr:50S ribosomal protein L18 [Bacillota bacterium]MCL2770813.1 50S ribosomal protein L18 [Bacillota bacterium]